MKILGITGGVGSGKSSILQFLNEEYGAVLCKMDETARQLQKKGTPCYEKIVSEFGTEILDDCGELNRKMLAEIVFTNQEKLDQLNAIVHPEVIGEVKKTIKECEKDSCCLFVLEAALLPDVGRELCDELWYIYTDEKVRRQRLKSSRGYTDEKITHILAAQPEEKEFRAVCRTVIDNSGDFEDTKKQIGEKLKL